MCTETAGTGNAGFERCCVYDRFKTRVVVGLHAWYLVYARSKISKNDRAQSKRRLLIVGTEP